jgi:hypothetical protein
MTLSKQRPVEPLELEFPSVSVVSAMVTAGMVQTRRTPAVCGPAKYGHDQVIDAVANDLGASKLSLNLAHYARFADSGNMLASDLARQLGVTTNDSATIGRVLDAAASHDAPVNRLLVLWAIDELEPRDVESIRPLLAALDTHPIVGAKAGWLRPVYFATVPSVRFRSILGTYRLGKAAVQDLRSLTTEEIVGIGAAVGWDEAVVAVVERETEGHPFLVRCLVSSYDMEMRDEIVRRRRWPLADSDHGPFAAFFAEVRAARSVLPGVESALSAIGDGRIAGTPLDAVQRFLDRWIYIFDGSSTADTLYKHELGPKRVPAALRRWLAR